MKCHIGLFYLFSTYLYIEVRNTTGVQLVYSTVYMYIPGRSCDDQKTILHAAYIAVIVLLVIVILIILVMLWRTRSCLGK